jgi:hypothetical protein
MNVGPVGTGSAETAARDCVATDPHFVYAHFPGWHLGNDDEQTREDDAGLGSQVNRLCRILTKRSALRTGIRAIARIPKFV